ncbi:MAG: GNAT family N-acetyltransferase [Acidobacteriota bacterium]|nr:GNAT family N-acetyltransferase [Acidobacteriota bacterium]
MSDSVELRPITAEDEAFLMRVYFSTREEELRPVPWSDEQKAAFLEQQFRAQHDFYRQQFPDARFDLVLHYGQPVGRLYVDRREDEIRIIDIALLTEARGKGLGGRLLEELLAEAREAGKAVRIHVERNNPALRLYHRLGFESIEDQGVYYLMEWRPESDD